MIKTTDFSYDLIYEQIQDFCIEHNITKDDFRYKKPYLVYEQTLYNNFTLEHVNAFRLSQDHPLFSELTDYLEKKYRFESKLIKLIYRYEAIYNFDESSSIERTFYLLDDQKKLRMANTFEFMNLDNYDYDILLVEVSDSNIENLDDELFDFYKRNIIKNSLPEEFQKPLTKLSNEEIDVIQMTFI